MLRADVSSSPIPLPLLISGIAGPSGYHALHYFQARYPGRVIGIRQLDTWRLEGPGVVACNTEDLEGLERLFDCHRFRAVLDCAGSCALKACQLDPVLARRANVEGVGHIAAVAQARGVRLVHLSVDLVFGGKEGGGYVETDADRPGHRLQQDDEGEQIIRASIGGVILLDVAADGGQFQQPPAVDWIALPLPQIALATLYTDSAHRPTEVASAGCNARRRSEFTAALPDCPGDCRLRSPGCCWNAGVTPGRSRRDRRRDLDSGKHRRSGASIPSALGRSIRV